MSLHAAAKHLASKGRNGDTTLVHMTKGEVAGLQALAKKHGTSLTTNPHTGLPEAFSLKSLVPMAAGAALTPFVGPMGAAAIVGGLGYMQSGSLTQGLMAGLGAYGGAGLAGGLSSMGTEAGTQLAAGEAEAAAAKAVTEEQTKQAMLQEAASGVGAAPPLAPTVSSEAALQSTADYASNAAGNTYELAGGYRPTFGPADAYAPGAGPAVSMDAMVPSNTGFTASTQQTLAQPPMQSGLSAAIDKPGAYVDKLGGGMQTAKYGAAAAAPAIADAMTPDAYVPPEIKGDSDMGQRYAYDSGYNNNIPGRTGPAAYTQVSNEEAKKLYGFADGGDVQYPAGESVIRMADGGPAVGYGADVGGYGADVDGYSGYGADVDGYSGYDTGNVGNYSGYDTAPNQGITAVAKANPNQNIVDLYAKVEAKRIADEAKAAEEKRIADEAAAAAVVPDYGYAFGGGAQGGLMPANLRYAKGGETSSDSIYSHGIDYSGYDTPANQGITASLPKAEASTNQRIAALYKQVEARRAAEEAAGAPSLYGGLTAQKGNTFPALLGAKMVGYDDSGNPVYAGGAWDPMAYQPDANGVYGPGTVQYSMQNGTFMNQSQPTYAAQGGLMDSYANGGSTLGGYSDGGRLLRGPGDGVSDSIPAVIGRKQPARLADGEFVVPARIVSEIGNGSTEAGARKLYAMMDRVQKARGKTVGKGKVAKNTRADKFLPA